MITFGRHGGEENLLLDRAELEARGVEIVKTDRGGNITCHFPGQLVAYPVFRVGKRTNGLHGFVRTLEEIVIRSAAAFGVEAARWEGRPAYGSTTASCARSACACATGCPSTASRSTWGTIFPFSAPLPCAASTMPRPHPCPASAATIPFPCRRSKMSAPRIPNPLCGSPRGSVLSCPATTPSPIPAPSWKGLICTRSATAPSVRTCSNASHARPPRSSSSATPAPATVPSATSAAASSTRPTPKSPPAWARQRRPSACAMPW